MKKKTILVMALGFGAIAIMMAVGAWRIYTHRQAGEYAGETVALKVFFSNGKLDPELSCNKVFPVERRVPKTAAVARAALDELLKGPTKAEEAGGYFTSIHNKGVKILSLKVEDGTAHVDFDETLQKGVGGSCTVSAIRAEITETLKQFPTVKDVVISVEGDSETALQP